MTVLVLPRSEFSSESKLAKILDRLGWKISHSRQEPFDFVLWHSDDVPRSIGDVPRFVNWRYKAIDKARVNEVFEQVFGYPIGVDPKTYEGLAVEKILGHETHGKVVRCPCNPNPERVYQKLITNHPEQTWLEEWRIDVHGTDLLVTRKQIEKDATGFPLMTRKPGAFHFDCRLDWMSDSWVEVRGKKLNELGLVKEFLRVIGLEYGSLDALRDLDGRLYIIDATTNTSCPNPSWHGNVTEAQYIKRSAEYFERAFGK